MSYVADNFSLSGSPLRLTPRLLTLAAADDAATTTALARAELVASFAEAGRVLLAGRPFAFGYLFHLKWAETLFNLALIKTPPYKGARLYRSSALIACRLGGALLPFSVVGQKQVALFELRPVLFTKVSLGTAGGPSVALLLLMGVLPVAAPAFCAGRWRRFGFGFYGDLLFFRFYGSSFLPVRAF